MNKANIHLADKNFQSQQSGNCNLLMKISEDRFSYAVIDQTNDQLKVLFDSPLEAGWRTLKTMIAGDRLLKFNYNKIKISVHTSKFTFIPAEIYSDSDIDSYAVFAYPSLQSDILVKDIRSVRVKNIMAIDKNLREYLVGVFSNAVIFSQVNPLIESSLRLYKTSNTILVLQFNEGSFEALVLKEGALLYYNLFDIQSHNEFNYFLLGILRDLQLKGTGTDVMLSGEIRENDKSYQCISKYFRNISFADTGIMVRQASIFREVVPHQFVSLIGLNLCE